MKRVLLVVGIICLLFVSTGVGVVGGVVLDRTVLSAVAPSDIIPAGAIQQFKLMGEAWNTIEQVYVDRSALDAQKLAYGAIAGMVDALGDTGHSRFLSPDMVKEEQKFTNGEFEGIGVEVQTNGRYTVVIAPIDNTPAQKAGLRPGDVILKVDGVDMTGLPLTEVQAHILGAAGTPVTLTILTPSTGVTRDVTLVRARIALQNVTWAILPGTTVAHIRVAAFSQGVTNDLRKAIAGAQQQGATALILDLRSDPGGLLDEAVGVASQFLAGGNVLQVKDVNGKVSAITVQGNASAPDIPMAVLIDGGTASAAEIVAGALQDAHRGVLVGETTFGTGTVLRSFNLSDGSALLLATQEWLTRDGRQIWHKGISPDVEVPLAPDAQPLLPSGERSLTAEDVQKSTDTQVLKALETLKQSVQQTQ